MFSFRKLRGLGKGFIAIGNDFIGLKLECINKTTMLNEN